MQLSFEFNHGHNGACDLCSENSKVLLDISNDGDGSCLVCGDCLEPETLNPPKDTNPKTIYGKAKPSISLIPASALIHCADAFRDGAHKYGPANWRDDPVSASTYVDAAYRHLMDWFDGEEAAKDSKVLHLGHAMACLAIIIDAKEQGTLVDDRPRPGKASEIIERLTRPIQ